MSNPVVDEPDAASAGTGGEAVGGDRDRSQTTEDASARDWADTGDPAHVPDLPSTKDGASAADDAAAGEPGAAGRDATEPSAAEAAAADQDATGPSAAEASAADQDATGPSAAEPSVDGAGATEPGVPGPAVLASADPEQAVDGKASPKRRLFGRRGATTAAGPPDPSVVEDRDGAPADAVASEDGASTDEDDAALARASRRAPADEPEASAARSSRHAKAEDAGGTVPAQPEAPVPTHDDDADAEDAGSDDLASPALAQPDPAPVEPEPRTIVRATGPPRRPPLLVQGLWPALLAGALAAAATFGLLPLAVAVLGVQVFLVLGALALLDAPAAGGAFLVATGATVAADALVLVDDGQVTGLAGAAGLGLVASLVHQLSRKGRSRVTESLADTLVVIVVSVGAACLLALHQTDGGEQVLLTSLAATGAVLLAGRVGDRLAPRPMLAIGSTRGWPGLLLGLGAGVSCALLVADAGGELPLRSAALLGLVIASTVATADLAVDLGAAELRSGWRDARRVAALRPTALLLPYAVLGPIALLAGRLVLA